jgi:hypothetical protein
MERGLEEASGDDEFGLGMGTEKYELKFVVLMGKNMGRCTSEKLQRI